MSRESEFFRIPNDLLPPYVPKWSAADFLLDGEVPPDAFSKDVELLRTATQYYLDALPFENAPRPDDR